MTASRMLTSEHMITILCVFFALVAAMCASIVVTCRNKIRDRRRKRREYQAARRSKEVSVEVLGLEAALAAQAAEIGAARGRKPGWDADDNNCYVPEVDLSIFEKSPNGLGAAHIVDPMCREHGDLQRSGSPPLPPPPPPPYLRRSRENPPPPPCQRHCPLADDDPPSFDSTRSAPDVIVHR